MVELKKATIEQISKELSKRKDVERYVLAVGRANGTVLHCNNLENNAMNDMVQSTLHVVLSGNYTQMGVKHGPNHAQDHTEATRIS